jgi:golgi-specific brefeldin A-resistance guanine nucleotide exchange factor 1
MELSVSSSRLIYLETLSVMSTMRKNARWASITRHKPARGSTTNSLSGGMGLRKYEIGGTQAARAAEKREGDLLIAFEELKRDIRDVQSQL